MIEGFGKPFCLDRNRNGGGIMLFIRSDIPAKVISTDKNPFKSFYFELNVRKHNFTTFENRILLGDFNSCMDDSPMIGFCETYKLRNLVKHPTCLKNPENP